MALNPVDDFLNGHQSLKALLAAYNVDLTDVPQDLSADLVRRDDVHALIRAWCRFGRRFGRTGRLTPLLCAWLARDDHQSHEDLAETLQDLRDPVSIECLFACAGRRLSYLDHNDSSALGRKCVWAMNDIGTPEAISRLEALTNDPREAVSTEAASRLEALRTRRLTDETLPHRRARDSKLGSL